MNIHYNKNINALGNALGGLSFISIALTLIDKFGFIEVGNAGIWFLVALGFLILSTIFKAVSGYFSTREAIVNFVRIFVGGLFIFSGFVKAIDPLGTSYKMGEYFEEFGLVFLDQLSVGISVFMIVMEIVLGVSLLLGYPIRLTSWLLLLMIIFFTFLTGYTSITGNVTDCGCFGDFLKLKPIESFTKDLVLLAFILIIFFNKRHIEPLVDRFFALPALAGVTILSLIFCFSNYVWDIPVMDFRPYKVGNNINEQMIEIPAKVEYTGWVYKNKNTGEVKEFSDEEFDKVFNEEFKENWEFVERKENVLKEGVPAPIMSFEIYNEDGDDIGWKILEDSGYVFMVVSYNLDETNTKAFTEKLNPLAAACDKAGYEFFNVSAATQEQIEKFRHEYQTAYPFYSADPVFLKTIIRSNPGLVLFKNAVVVAKWHHCKIPTFEEIKKNYLNE